MSLSEQWSPASVQVTVLQARGLRVKGKSGTNDAYAVMQVAKEKYQTSVAEKSVAPVWQEEAAFDLPTPGGGGGGPERTTLHVHVLHRALVGPDKLLGQAVINLLQLSQDRSRSKTEWFKLLDKTGKPDKDRGEVLLDIQFMRNNMTSSMFDLSAAGKSRSRLGKLKDKVRGKKKESDSASGVAPSFSQVLTDSEDEANGDGRNKKHKMKSLFSTKSNLQKTMSQSMSILPAQNSSLSGSQSSGLNVDSSQGKKKFKFKIHKRSGSSDLKDSSSGQKQAPVEQTNLCINGSHIYCEEPPARTSRIGSNFSLTSSGLGSMEYVPENSPPSVDSLRGGRQCSPWTEEEEEEAAEEEKEGDVDKSRGEEEEKSRMEEVRRKSEEEEEGRKQQEQLEKLEVEMMRQEREKRRIEAEEYQREEEEKARREEEVRARREQETFQRKQEEERIRIETQERMRKEEEERIRLEEERKRIEEERIRREEQRKRIEEEENIKREEERKRVEEERIRRDEDERKRIEEDRIRLEEEKKRIEAEEKIRLEEERKRIEEEERIRLEEERIRLEEERKRVEEEEKIRLEEKKRIEEEEKIRLEEERRRIEAEEKIQLEKERKRLEEEERIRLEEERKRIEEEEKIRLEEERKRVEEEERIRLEEERKRIEEKERIRLEEERKRIEEEERIRLEEKKRIEEERIRLEEERKRVEEKERIRLEEERKRIEEEEKIRLEEKRIEEEEKIQLEKERKRLEEEENIRLEEERIRLEEERKRVEEEEKIRLEEKKRIEEEEKIRLEEERKRIEAEEKIQLEKERKRIEEQQQLREQEEKRKKQEEEETRKEMERQKETSSVKEEKVRKEKGARAEREKNVETKRPEKCLAKEAEEKERKDQNEKIGLRVSGRRTKLSVPAEIISTNPFDENFSSNPFEEPSRSDSGPQSSTVGEAASQQRCQSGVPSKANDTAPSEEKNLIGTQREKRLAPQPPGRSQTEKRCQMEQHASTTHPAQINKHGRDKDIKTVSVSPQRHVQAISPLSRCPTDSKDPHSLTESASVKGMANPAKRPAPSKPLSVEELPPDGRTPRDSETKQVRVVSSLNPFEEDEDENELAAHDDAAVSGGTRSVVWPLPVSQTLDHDAASLTKIKSSKVARAPPPPAVNDPTSNAENGQNTIGHIAENTGGAQPDKTDNKAPAEATLSERVEERPLQETQSTKVQSSIEVGVKKPGPPVALRRLQPVKPLNPVEQPAVLVVQGENDNNSPEILSGIQDKTKIDTKNKGPYSQLTRDELISLVVKQERQLSERDKKISDLEQYIDTLLVRVIEEQPSILMSLSSVKKPT
ncbi:myosin-2 heavy chain-like isoform X2 [Salarias fasciatus]|uniref:Myosin-2 heavy chain-like n=1 Tax=Salarias fasciatus TaxID=181472 RepID=A0A672FG23_SALFA|nr:myosin-2 heavy chain-like isoform X2 [Salarias fasciatus]